MPSESQRKAGWVKGVYRRTPVNLQEEFKQAVEVIATSPPLGAIPMGLVLERAFLLFLDQMPRSAARTKALHLIRYARAHSEDTKSKPSPRPGSNGDSRLPPGI